MVTEGQGFRRYMHDQDGMRAIGVAVAALTFDPSPQDAFIRGDVITIERVDQVL